MYLGETCGVAVIMQNGDLLRKTGGKGGKVVILLFGLIASPLSYHSVLAIRWVAHVDDANKAKDTMYDMIEERLLDKK
jgi:hypothetical protein